MTNDGRPAESDLGTTVVSLESPTLEVATETITTAIDHGDLLTVVGRCRIDGSSVAAREAVRRVTGVTVVKPDGTVLVHGSEGVNPVASIPPGTELSVSIDGDALVLESQRDGSEDGGDNDSRPSEPTDASAVRFESVTQLTTVGSKRESEPEPTRERVRSARPQRSPEADLRQRLLERPTLLEPGFTPLATERETPAGPVDVYGEDASGRTVVLELKSRRAGPDAVSQLRRYVDALERDLHVETTVRGILVAPSVTARADRLLARYGLEFVALEANADH